MAFPPNFTNSWDTTFPVDTELANLLGANLRQLRVDIMQRMSLLSGTFANRPTPEVVNANWGGVGYGLIYFATDTNQMFQWNGATWADVSVNFVKSSLLNSQSNLAAIIGNGAAQAFYTYNVPASTVANLQALRLSIGWSHSTGANNVGFLVTLNGVTIFGPVNRADVGSATFEGTILNTGAATASGVSNFTFAGAPGGVVPQLNIIAAGLNWAGLQTLQITFNTPVTDQLTPYQWLVELVR